MTLGLLQPLEDSTRERFTRSVIGMCEGLYAPTFSGPQPVGA